jgi:hypothetical protein
VPMWLLEQGLWLRRLQLTRVQASRSRCSSWLQNGAAKGGAGELGYRGEGGGAERGALLELAAQQGGWNRAHML